MTSNNVIGEVIMYSGENEPINWILCDGIQRINKDNIYKNIIELGIGEINNEYYIPPNYSDTIMASVHDNDKQILKQISDSVTLVDKCEGTHFYMINYKYVKNYNNMYRNITDKDIDYLNHNKNEIKEDLKQSNNIKIKKNAIKWLIRYKLD